MWPARRLINLLLAPRSCARSTALVRIPNVGGNYQLAQADAGAGVVTELRRGLADAPPAGGGVGGGEAAVADYEEVARATQDTKGVIVDVREPHELAERGQIPRAINIPLGSVDEALKMSPQQFEQTYGCRKPTPDTALIFYCQVGKRSHQALVLAKQLGYYKSKNYLGSYDEWASKEILK